MLGSGVLELAIGLSVVFLVFSSVCSGIREFCARVFSEREKMLRRGVYRLLGGAAPSSVDNGSAPAMAAPSASDPAAHGARIQPHLASLVLGHPLITNLAMKAGSSPSYIPARTFALALLDVLVPGEQGPRTVAAVRSVVVSMDNAAVRNALLPLIDAAGDDIHKLQMSLERRFDDTMDRVSGWYRRHSQVIIFYIAVGVAGAFNVDALHVSQALWTEPTLRARIAQEGASTVPPQAVPSDGAGSAAAANAAAQALSRRVMADAPLPVGWDFVTNDAKEREPLAWAWRIVGWLLTALALSLGAPFWFDLLSRLVNLRAAGPQPARADDTLAPDAIK